MWKKISFSILEEYVSRNEGAREGVRKGASIFSGSKVGNFATRVFPQDLRLPASPATPFNDVSCLLYGYYRASSTLSRPPSPPRKLSSPITGVWPFSASALIRKFLLLLLFLPRRSSSSSSFPLNPPFPRDVRTPPSPYSPALEHATGQGY